MAAYGDDEFEVLVRELVERLAPLAGNVDAGFLHHSYRQRIETVLLYTG